MLKRSTRHAAPTPAFTPIEIDLLNRLSPIRAYAKTRRPASPASCATQLARLGGYLARTGDGPPGNAVIWRGLLWLTDIEIGYVPGTRNIGN